MICSGQLFIVGMVMSVFGLTSPFKAKSQNPESAMPEYKYQIGLKLSSVKSGVPKLIPPSEFNTVFNWGVFVDRHLTKSFSIESGLSYVRKNTDIASDQAPNIAVNYMFHNLRIPILVKAEYKFIYTSLGIYGDYFLDYSVDDGNNTGKFNYTINNFNVGGSLNIGLQWRIYNKIGLFVEAGINPDFISSIDEAYCRFVDYGISFGTVYKF